jgi:protoheme IX farnesyltransferase
MPPLIGWAAAREDYARGGFKMLPAFDTTGQATGRQMVLYSWALFPVALLPSILGMAGTLYLVAALALGFVFVWSATRVAMMPSNANARRLLQMTIIYLPVLFAFLMLDKR